MRFIRTETEVRTSVTQVSRFNSLTISRVGIFQLQMLFQLFIFQLILVMVNIIFSVTVTIDLNHTDLLLCTNRQ